MKRSSKTRVLFMGEGVTFAHVSRPLALAQSLPSDEFEVLIAADPIYHHLVRGLPNPPIAMACVQPALFQSRLMSGSPLLTTAEIRQHVEEDIRLISEFSPEIVIGDFRLSLSVSAALCKVPYMAITNAYWALGNSNPFPVPDNIPHHVMHRLLGGRAAARVVRSVVPIFLAWHAMGHNFIRREYGLPGSFRDFREVLMLSDCTLLADSPLLSPLESLEPQMHYMGPLLWSMPCRLPEWWSRIPEGADCIFLSLGSSGEARLVRSVIEALSGFPGMVLLATAGRVSLEGLPPNVLASDFLPARDVMRRSRLVICNGGSPMSHLALSLGKPVIGLASNIDHYLCMQCVEKVGAGVTVRSSEFKQSSFKSLVARLWSNQEICRSAALVAEEFQKYAAPQRFRSLLEVTLAARRSGQAANSDSGRGSRDNDDVVHGLN